MNSRESYAILQLIEKSYENASGEASEIVAVKGLTAATTLTVESAIETLVEEITYSLKTGNISLISAFLNFFTNIGFNKIAEVPQKVLRSIGETLEKWGVTS